MKDLEMKKLYYSISEVSRMVDLEPYELRYWEREFPALQPQKNRAGNRIYTEKDIELVRIIKRLTRQDRYTISGARQVLEALTYENGLPILPEGIEQAPAENTEVDEELNADLLIVREKLEQVLGALRNAVEN